VPLVLFGLIDVGGLSGLQESIGQADFFHAWANTGSTDNPMAVHWFAIVFGLGFVQSFRLLVHGLPRRAAGAGGRGRGRGAADPAHRGVPEAHVRGAGDLPRPDHPVHPPEPRRGQLQHGRPLRDGLLLPDRDARRRPDGAARRVHERDGGQRDGLQHRLDLRHLQGVHQPGRPRPPLPQRGPHSHRWRASP
jgi:hypothetical protein